VAEPLKRFAEQLRDLQTDAGKPTLDWLAAHLPDYPRSTINDKLQGQSRPSWEFVEAFVNVCKELGAETDELAVWYERHRRLLQDLGRARAGQRRGREAAGESARQVTELPEQHWLASGRGSSTSSSEFRFTGRRRVLDALGAFATGNGRGLMVVTGMPGAGKSAVLAVLVLRSRWPDRLPAALVDAVADGQVSAAVHARDKSVAQVYAEILLAVRGSDSVSDHVDDTALEASLERAIETELDPKRPLTIVIDAVDEARDPSALGEAILKLSFRSRVLIGVRPEGPVDGSARIPGELRAASVAVVDLDAPDWFDRGDIATYVGQRLLDDPRADGYGTGDWTARTLVEVVGSEIEAVVAKTNFLIAQFVVEELLSRPVVDIRPRGWSLSMDWPHRLEGWIKRDVNRRLDGEVERISAVLTPLAHSLRGGLPVDLWRAVVHQLVTASDADERLDLAVARLGFYLTKVGGDPDRYALRHERFATYFREHGLPGRIDSAFVDVLVGQLPRNPGGRDWSRPPRYTTQNLAAHAGVAGRLAELVGAHPASLAALDPLAVLAALDGTSDDVCRGARTAVRRASYASGEEFGRRAAALQFQAAYLGLVQLSWSLMTQARPALPWYTPWRAGGMGGGASALGSAMRTQSMLGVAGPEGQPAYVVVGVDGRCQLRDAVTGRALGPPVIVELGHAAPPLFHAWSAAGGAVRLAVGTARGMITIWTLSGDTTAAGPWLEFCASAPLSAMIVLPGPRGVDLLVALGGDPGTISCWPLRPLRDDDALPALFTAPTDAQRLVPLDRAGDVVAFLAINGACVVTPWRISLSGPSVQQPVELAARDVHAVLAVGDAEAAHVAYQTQQSVRAIWLSGGLAVATPVDLVDGDRTARIALGLAAIGDGYGEVQTFQLDRDQVVALGVTDTTAPIHTVRMVEDGSTTAAVGDWTGLVRITDLATSGGGTLVLRHGSRVDQIIRLGRTDCGPVIATRDLSGGTRVWQLDRVDTSVPDGPEYTMMASFSVGGRQFVAASTGHSRVHIWLVEHEAAIEEHAIHELPESAQALAAVNIGGYAWLGIAGEATLSVLRLDGDQSVMLSADVEQPDVETVTMLPGHSATPLIATSGPEGVRIFAATEGAIRPVFADPDIPVTTVALDCDPDGRFSFVIGDDDGMIHVFTNTAEDAVVHRTIEHGSPIAAVAVGRIGRALLIMAADRYQGMTHWHVDGDEITETVVLRGLWHIQRLAAVQSGDGCRFLAATDVGRLLVYLVDSTGEVQEVDQPSVPDGRAVHVATHATTSAVVYSSGAVLLIDPVRGRSTVAELNQNPAAFVSLAGSSLFAGTHGGIVYAIRPSWE
jgi:WD40 repeat protein